MVTATINRALGCERPVSAGGYRGSQKEREVFSMKKLTIVFAVTTENGVVNQIGRSSIQQPAIHFKGGSVKWFDDSQLLKKGCAKL